MTLSEFAKGFMEGRYCFQRPQNENELEGYRIFVNQLSGYIPKDWYDWAAPTFEEYAMDGSEIKYCKTHDHCQTETGKGCTGSVDVQGGYTLVNYEDLISADDADFEELIAL